LVDTAICLHFVYQPENTHFKTG